jgi:hypothetical protein
VIVLVGVLLTAMLTAGPLTRRVAGHPAALAVAGAPMIGDCVTGFPMAERGIEVDQTLDFPTAEFGPCDRPIVGEVSSTVDRAVAPPRRITGAEYWPMSAQCALDAIGYLGSIPPVVDQGAGRPGILWTPSVSIAYLPIGPNAAQRTLGQHWSACVVGSNDGTAYTGRLQQALSSGVLPAVFGSCWPASYFRTARQTPCDQPHVVELLGTTLLGTHPVPAAEVRGACAQFAGRVMRTADPTRQGAIVVDIVGDDRGFADLPSGENYLQDRDVSCYAKAAAGSRFNGTLVGIGDGPLPLVR